VDRRNVKQAVSPRSSKPKEYAMAQDELDQFMKFLEDNPEEMAAVKELRGREIVGYARAKGYRFSWEDLQARQALVHLIEGT
jgi:hypothetical protein